MRLQLTWPKRREGVYTLTDNPSVTSKNDVSVTPPDTPLIRIIPCGGRRMDGGPGYSVK
jgi:hypothetical protein